MLRLPDRARLITQVLTGQHARRVDRRLDALDANFAEARALCEALDGGLEDLRELGGAHDTALMDVHGLVTELYTGEPGLAAAPPAGEVLEAQTHAGRERGGRGGGAR